MYNGSVHRAPGTEVSDHAEHLREPKAPQEMGSRNHEVATIGHFQSICMMGNVVFAVINHLAHQDSHNSDATDAVAWGSVPSGALIVVMK